MVRGTDPGTHRGDFMGFPASGREVTTTWIEIFRMEHGKAAEGWLESDRRLTPPRVGLQTGWLRSGHWVGIHDVRLCAA